MTRTWTSSAISVSIAVPHPGGPRELSALVGDLFAFKLERGRPLWEVWFIEGLEGGRIGLLLKVHHSLVDGVHATRLYEVLFDLDPAAPSRPARHARGRARADPVGVGDGPASAAPAGDDPAARRRARPDTSAAPLSGWRAFVSRGNGRRPPSPSRRRARRSTGPSRRIADFAFCSLPLADIKAIKNAFSLTVNDVVLGICTGALRHYLADRGELPSRPLIAQIPVAVHGDDDDPVGQRGRGDGRRPCPHTSTTPASGSG